MSEEAFIHGDNVAREARWRTILLVGVASLGAAVLVALLLTLGNANRQRDKALQLQSHSYEVMILARTVSGTIARAEATLGRYVISGDRALGSNYVDDWSLAGSQLERLDIVTDDNGEQAKPIEQLRQAYVERGEDLSLIALNTNYGKNAQALARYYAARRAPALGKINTLLDGIIDRERKLLDIRSADAEASVERSNRLAAVLAAFGVLLVLGAIALGWTTVAARNEAETQGQRAIELEDAVAAATAELQAEIRERLDAEAKLRQSQKMEAVGQLTGGIAHDFNNMLAVVVGGLELARRHVRSGEAIRHIDNAMDGANRAAALTKRLLAFARAEPLLPEAIIPAALIAGMADLMDRTLGEAITVEVQADASADWRVWADKHQLENALLNLCVNARDAMEGRGTLTIATGHVTLAAAEVGACAAGDHATIAVSDTGSGMDAETLERVFEPFFTTKPAGQGTGLGLSQIFAFVRQSDGEVAIRSTPGAGTTVTLYLPRHHARPTEVPAAAAILPASVLPASLDILVVEDDPRVLASTLDALKELGHRATGCADPLQIHAALEALGPLDLIISDVLMPGLTGPEMIAALDPIYADLPVLFVTGYAGELEAEQFGGHAVLRKPFTIAALARSVGEAAGRRGIVQPQAAE